MNIYQTFYDLLQTYVFGGEILANSIPDLVATLFSTGATLFVVAVPFVVVLKVINFIVGGINR